MSQNNDIEQRVIQIVSKYTNKTLSRTDINNIRGLLSGIDKNLSIQDIANYVIVNMSGMVDDYMQNEIKSSGDNPISYYDEELTASIDKFLQYQADNIYKLSMLINPSSKEVYSYIMFDTDNKNTHLSSDGNYYWELNDDLPIYQQGIINLYSKLYPIKRMRLARTILSNLQMTEFSKLIHSNGNRFAITIKNFETQSFKAANGLNFHFIQYLLDSRVASNPSLSSFNANKGWYYFNEPHRNVNSIGISITDLESPDTPIIIHEDNSVIESQTFYTLGNEIEIEVVQLYGYEIVSSIYGSITNPIFITDVAIQNLGMSWANISPTGVPDVNGVGISKVEFQFGGWGAVNPANPTQAALIEAYNIMAPLVKHHQTWFHPPVPIDDTDRDIGLYDITLTFKYKPRMTTVLELISDVE